MTKGRLILAAIVVVLVGFATVQGLRPKAPPPVEVTTSVAKKGSVTRMVTAAGHLQARETVKVSSNVTGDLLSLSVEEGDRVHRGQVLGQIDKRLYETQVAQFRGALASAKAQIEQIEVAIDQDKRDLARGAQAGRRAAREHLRSGEGADAAQVGRGPAGGAESSSWRRTRASSTPPSTTSRAPR